MRARHSKYKLLIIDAQTEESTFKQKMEIIFKFMIKYYRQRKTNSHSIRISNSQQYVF